MKKIIFSAFSLISVLTYAQENISCTKSFLEKRIQITLPECDDNSKNEVLNNKNTEYRYSNHCYEYSVNLEIIHLKEGKEEIDEIFNVYLEQNEMNIKHTENEFQMHCIENNHKQKISYYVEHVYYNDEGKVIDTQNDTLSPLKESNKGYRYVAHIKDEEATLQESFFFTLDLLPNIIEKDGEIKTNNGDSIIESITMNPEIYKKRNKTEIINEDS